MSKTDKLLQKIRNNPQSVSFEDLDKILRFGMDLNPGNPRAVRAITSISVAVLGRSPSLARSLLSRRSM